MAMLMGDLYLYLNKEENYLPITRYFYVGSLLSGKKMNKTPGANVPVYMEKTFFSLPRPRAF
jgi:hypothetical protein